MALHHTAQKRRLTRISFFNYIKDELTDGGMTTGTNAVTVRDAFPSLEEYNTASTPSVIIHGMNWQAIPYELGGDDYVDYQVLITILAKNKNQREDLTDIIESFLRNKSTNILDYNQGGNPSIGKMYFQSVSASAPYTPIIGNLPEEFDYVMEISVTLRTFFD